MRSYFPPFHDTLNSKCLAVESDETLEKQSRPNLSALSVFKCLAAKWSETLGKVKRSSITELLVYKHLMGKPGEMLVKQKRFSLSALPDSKCFVSK